MYRKLERFPATRWNSGETDKIGDVAVSFSDTVFAFWEDVKSSSENSSSNSGEPDQLYDEEEEEENEIDDEDEQNFGSVQQNDAFWEEKDKLLQVLIN